MRNFVENNVFCISESCLPNSPSLPTAAVPRAPAKHKTKAARAVSISEIIAASIPIAVVVGASFFEKVVDILPIPTETLGTKALLVLSKHNAIAERRREATFIILGGILSFGYIFTTCIVKERGCQFQG